MPIFKTVLEIGGLSLECHVHHEPGTPDTRLDPGDPEETFLEEVYLLHRNEKISLNEFLLSFPEDSPEEGPFFAIEQLAVEAVQSDIEDFNNPEDPEEPEDD